MRVTRESILGETTLFAIELTEREKATLRRAAAIAEKFREKLRELYGRAVEVPASDAPAAHVVIDIDTTAAGIEHGVGELIERAAKLPTLGAMA